MDGTFIQGRKGIFIVMDSSKYQVIAGRSSMEEKTVTLIEFFKYLSRCNLLPISATIDGNPAIRKALIHVWPDIIVQRCLVHIQRQGLSWCRRKPYRTDAKHLRSIFLAVTEVDNHEKMDLFINQVMEWEYRFGPAIQTRVGSGKVFSDIKRARSMLLTALPDMFHYLNDNNITWSTNAVEGYFGRMKLKYRQHPGLSHGKQMAFFNWYMKLCNH